MNQVFGLMRWDTQDDVFLMEYKILLNKKTHFYYYLLIPSSKIH